MRIGRYRERVQIQSTTQSRSPIGGVRDEWSTDATVWARSRPAMGSEIYEGDKENGRRVRIFHMRPVLPTTLTYKKRLVWDSINWDIRDIRPHERGTETVVEAVEVIE